MSDEPLNHVLRTQLPWRDDLATECGRAASDVGAVITADEARAMSKRLGQQRFALVICMTCAHHVGASWDQNPERVIDREYGSGFGYGKHADRNRRELLALGILVAAHRDEYEQLLGDLIAAPDLDKVRADRAARRAFRRGSSR